MPRWHFGLPLSNLACHWGPRRNQPRISVADARTLGHDSPSRRLPRPQLPLLRPGTFSYSCSELIALGCSAQGECARFLRPACSWGTRFFVTYLKHHFQHHVPRGFSANTIRFTRPFMITPNPRPPFPVDAPEPYNFPARSASSPRSRSLLANTLSIVPFLNSPARAKRAVIRSLIAKTCAVNRANSWH